MATIQMSVTIEANEQELGQLASLLLGRMGPALFAAVGAAATDGPTTTPIDIDPTLKATPVSGEKSAPVVRPALIKSEPKLPAVVGKSERKQSGDRLPFESFDVLVRSEMRRLSMDKRMPGFKLWDDQRDKRLPTLGAVMARYGKSRLGDLAEVLGMQPPLTVSPAIVGVDGD